MIRPPPRRDLEDLEEDLALGQLPGRKEDSLGASRLVLLELENANLAGRHDLHAGEDGVWQVRLRRRPLSDEFDVDLTPRPAIRDVRLDDPAALSSIQSDKADASFCSPPAQPSRLARTRLWSFGQPLGDN